MGAGLILAITAAGGPTMQRLAPRLAAALRPAPLPSSVRLPAEAAAAAAVSYVSTQALDVPSHILKWRGKPASYFYTQPDPVLPFLTQRNVHTLARPLLAFRSTDWWFDQSLQRIGAGAMAAHCASAPGFTSAGPLM